VKGLSKDSAVSFLAGTLVLDSRRDAALAFPRPSDRASAKLEKRTVSHSQREIKPMKKGGLSGSREEADEKTYSG
jgi:hypothetical protein